MRDDENMIPKDKVRIAITLSKDGKQKLEELAKRETRTVSNYIEHKVQKEYEEYGKLKGED